MKKSTIVRLIRVGARASSAVSPRLAGRWLADLFTTTRRRPRPDREQTWARSASDTEVHLHDGTRLPVLTWGSGPTVLLVHGWDGRGTQLGAFAQPLVQAGFRVVTFDAPGHGGAPGSRSALPVLADAALAVAEAHGPIAHVIAHSLGTAAVTMALERGLEAERIAYIAPPLDPPRYLDQVGRLLGFSVDAREHAARALEDRYGVPIERFDGRRAAPLRHEDLLVIHDADDKEVPVDEGRSLATAWADARFVETRGLGHRRVLRDGDVIDAVVSWIADGREVRVA